MRISNTNRFRDPDGGDDAALCARLLDEVERTIVEAGPETVAMLIAEPVQNAGGCLTPPEGYWPGLRELCDRYGIALVADEVITGFGRIGEFFASSRYGVAPDLITCAKGITSAYAPMGAVIVSDKIAEPLYEEGRMLMHGITFAGHPVAAAIALRNVEIFEREGVLENVRTLEPFIAEGLGRIKDAAADRRRRPRRRLLLGARARPRQRERAVLRRGAREAAARLHRRPVARGRADRAARRSRRRRAAPRAAAGGDARGARGDVREDRGCARGRLGTLLRRVKHTAHGYWLEEAGAATAAPPLAGDVRADVVVIGGGYAGLWTAWQLRARGASVVLLEAELCGHGPSGRNGGFCETLWAHLPSLVERFGLERSLAICEASSESVGMIGDWCAENGVDAWFTRAGYMMASTAPAHDVFLDEILAVAPPGRVQGLSEAEVRARCDSPRFRRGVFIADDASVQPARLALGLRDRVIAAGASVFEHSRRARAAIR